MGVYSHARDAKSPLALGADDGGVADDSSGFSDDERDHCVRGNRWMIAVRGVYRYRYQMVSRRQWIGTVIAAPPVSTQESYAYILSWVGGIFLFLWLNC